jgi:hypothetical protein
VDKLFLADFLSLSSQSRAVEENVEECEALWKVFTTKSDSHFSHARSPVHSSYTHCYKYFFVTISSALFVTEKKASQPIYNAYKLRLVNFFFVTVRCCLKLTRFRPFWAQTCFLNTYYQILNGKYVAIFCYTHGMYCTVYFAGTNFKIIDFICTNK